MKPPPFAYAAPGSLEEALALLAEHGDDAKVLAGGQSLVPLLNFRLTRPAVLVDINGVEGLDGLGGGRIGALVRTRRLEREAAEPLLRRAASFVGHPQIRTRGTVCGSVAHADPAAELPCALVALGARARLRSVRGERELTLDELLLGPFTTALQPDELLVELDVPAQPAGTRAGFAEHARVHGDFALAGAAVVARPDALVVSLLAVAERPVRVELARRGGRRAARGGGGGCRGSRPGPPPGARGDARPPRARGGGVRVSLEVNGERVERDVEPRLTLADLLRHELRLTGTKVGCEHGVCGACTVHLDGEPIRSCLLLAVQGDGHAVTTVEGLEAPELRAAFHERHALQCGFCTPGFLMSADAFLREAHDPDEAEIRAALAGNLCRCTGYLALVEAV